MKVTLDVKELAKAVRLLRKVAPTRSPKRVLECCLVETDGESGVSLCATDLEMRGRIGIYAKVAEPGRALLDLAKAAVILRTASGSVELDAGADNQTRLAGIEIGEADNPEDFPAIDFPVDRELSSAFQLPLLLWRTEFACSKENSRYALNGVNLEGADCKLTAVATQGHMMAIAAAAWDGPDFGALVPGTFCQVVAGLGGEPRMSMSDEHSSLTLDWGWVQLGVRLVDRGFPKWRDAIPKKLGLEFEADSANLSVAIKAMVSLCDDQLKKAVVLYVDKDSVTVKPLGPKAEGGGVVVKAKAAGKAVQAFDGEYLLKILAVVGGPVRVSLGENSNKPAKIEYAPGKGFDMGGPDWKCIIMPVSMV